MTFQQKLDAMIKKNNSILCVGLDPKEPSFEFCKNIIDQTHDLICAYKPNSAFFEAQGARGIEELKKICDYLHEKYPEIPIILDAKRADIGSTNEGYVKFAFDYLSVDAITLNPYLGKKALQPFLEMKDKGCIILCRTSNEGSGEFQDLTTGDKSLYQQVAENVAKNWNENNNCMLVVGATYPEELKKVRKIVGDMTILVPGVGAQGGDLKKVIEHGSNSQGRGVIINVSRAIIFADNPRKAAKKFIPTP